MEKPLRALRPEGLKIIETLGCHDGTYVRLERHLRRLRGTAERLNFPYDSAAVERALEAAKGEGVVRVSLNLDTSGEVTTKAAPLVAVRPPWRLAISEQRLDSADPWLRVKTTRRALYDAVRVALPEDIDEVVFLNEQGSLCEGTITNIFVRFGGTLYTPPLACGLLPGILREELLELGKATERDLSPEDLLRAEGVCVGNSLRGLIPATFG